MLVPNVSIIFHATKSFVLFLNDCVHADGADSKPLYHKRKNYYKYQRSERLYPFKKRKHFAYGSQLDSGEGMSNEFVSDSPKKGNDEDAAGSCSKLHAGLFLHFCSDILL